MQAQPKGSSPDWPRLVRAMLDGFRAMLDGFRPNITSSSCQIQTRGKTSLFYFFGNHSRSIPISFGVFFKPLFLNRQ